MKDTARSALLARLTEGVTTLATSAGWRQWLDVQSRFHHYSFNNTLLILLQRPEASLVAGFGAWRKLGRCVRRGEKAIWILAPMVSRSASADPDDPGPRELRGFKPVPVFDLAQTEGRDLPEICRRLEGDVEGDVFERLAGVARSLGFVVHDADILPDAANGDCSHRRRRIRVLRGNSPAQRVKTLAHELGHAVLHEDVESRALAELEAESVAFIVCAANGIVSDRYSFGYVATWAGGGRQAAAAIRASGARIQRAADQVLAAMEGPAVAGVGPGGAAVPPGSAPGGQGGQVERPVGVEVRGADRRRGRDHGAPGPPQRQAGGDGEPGVGVVGSVLATAPRRGGRR